MKKTLSILIMSLLASSAWAMPKHVEVWFLSIDRGAFIEQLLPGVRYSKMTASLQCQKMGEYCFDPQVGLYKPDSEKSVHQTAVDHSAVENKAKYDFLPVAKSLDRNMIDCDKKSMWDIFCGKADGTAGPVSTKLELWIDTSSTMRQVDFPGLEKMCSRESFLEKVNILCPLNQKMKVYMFDTSKKELGSFDRVCLNSGLNDYKRMMRDIKASNVDHLIVITDIYEAAEEYINFVEMNGGSIKGIDKPMYARDLKSEVSRIQGMCK